MKKRRQKASSAADADTQELIEELASRQRFDRPPKRIADIISRLVARKGYGRLQSTAEFQNAWAAAVGEQMAKVSRAGNTRRGTLEVTVQNSVVAQELQFKKQQLLNELRTLITDCAISDIRFRVGEID